MGYNNLLFLMLALYGGNIYRLAHTPSLYLFPHPSSSDSKIPPLAVLTVVILPSPYCLVVSPLP